MSFFLRRRTIIILLIVLSIGCNKKVENYCNIDFDIIFNFFKNEIHYDLEKIITSEQEYNIIKKTKIQIGSIEVFNFCNFISLPIFLIIDTNCNHFINKIIIEEKKDAIFILNKMQFSKNDDREHFMKEYVKLRFFQYNYIQNNFHLEKYFLSDFIMLNKNIFEISDSASLNTFEKYLKGEKNIFDIFFEYNDPIFLWEKHFSDERYYTHYKFYKKSIKDNFLKNISLSIYDDSISYFYTLPDLKVYKFINLSNEDSLNFDYELLNDGTMYSYFNWNASFDGKPLFYKSE